MLCIYNNGQVVGVDEGQIALALLKGQKELSLGMSPTRWDFTSYKCKDFFTYTDEITPVTHLFLAICRGYNFMKLKRL